MCTTTCTEDTPTCDQANNNNNAVCCCPTDECKDVFDVRHYFYVLAKLQISS